jgi:hypothetical protein
MPKRNCAGASIVHLSQISAGKNGLYVVQIISILPQILYLSSMHSPQYSSLAVVCNSANKSQILKAHHSHGKNAEDICINGSIASCR